MIVTAVLLSTLTATNAEVRGPHGTYCGSYSFGLVTGKVTFDDAAKTFDLTFDGLGAHVRCGHEAYSMEADGTLIIPGVSSPDNCLGSVLESNGLSLDALYHSNDDAVDLDLGLASLTASKC
jgi:hypothetical protein